MALLRTREMTERYREHQKVRPLDSHCAMCDKESIQDFQHWKLLKNDFPYDLIASEHDILVPKRHVTEDALSAEETEELFNIKTKLLDQKYDFIIEAAHKNKSFPAHFHLHLIVVKG